MTASAWDRFLHEGAQLASALQTVLSSDPEQTQHGAALDLLMALEMDARMVGVPELADLAEALRLSVAALQGRRPGAEQLQPLAHAADIVAHAFVELAQPDASGAHVSTERLVATRDALRQGSLHPSLPPLPPSRPAAAPVFPVEDDSLWEPQVDEDMIDPFLEECQERLEGLAQRLVELERSPDDAELVRAVFRDLHTLKGSSAFVGLKRMTRLAHAAEDLVGAVRDGRRAVDRGVVDSLLAALDGLTAIVQRATARAPIDVDVTPLLARLEGGPAAAVARSAPATTTDAVAPAATQIGASRAQTLRIGFEKLDLLMNLVGELVLAKGRLSVSFGGLGSIRRELGEQRRNAVAIRQGSGSARRRAGAVRSQDLPTELGRVERAFDQLSSELEVAGQQLDFVAGELRDQVMKLRMVPIGRTWSKYNRTVREIAGKLGKQVRLELVGAETELDKVLVEQLDDPFLHLVRNAIDHGIEGPEQRVASGKTGEGLLRLTAGHRGNQIVIRIEDDGRGIDVEGVRRKAVEKGLVDADAAASLEENQIFDLLFRPGFSTAAAVSDLSGRGVGMDVVRETISQLKGTVSVDSRPGQGSSFEIRLPLTLAIVQVLLLRCGGETYAVPIDLVERTVAAPAAAIRRATNREVLYDGVRDLPLIRLRDALGLASAGGGMTADHPVVVVDVAGQSYGLLCDGFLGRQEIVIKSLGKVLARVPGAAGATLIGDRCVLILDVPAVVAIAQAAPSHAIRVGAVEEPEGVHPDAATNPHILVAEDADVIREAIRRALVAAGYRVTTARDGNEALALATAEHFDLVSTDVVMPGMDGYELTRRLRASPEYRDVPIVMVTSKEERIDRIRGFDAGVDAYLTKPTDSAELLRVIRKHLSSAGRG